MLKKMKRKTGIDYPEEFGFKKQNKAKSLTPVTERQQYALCPTLMHLTNDSESPMSPVEWQECANWAPAWG